MSEFAFTYEEHWRNIISKEILITCPDVAEWGEECPDCTEVAKFVLNHRTERK